MDQTLHSVELQVVIILVRQNQFNERGNELFCTAMH